MGWWRRGRAETGAAGRVIFLISRRRTAESGTNDIFGNVARRVCHSEVGRRIHMKTAWVSMAASVAIAAAGWAGYRLWPRKIEIRTTPLTPVWESLADRAVVRLPQRFLVAEVASYDDELFAYLMFSYLRARPVFRNTEVLLTYRKVPNGIVYPIQVSIENDLLSAVFLLAEARAAGLIQQDSWRYVTAEALHQLQSETRVFVTAYNLPTRRRLEHLTKADLVAYVRRFVRFKSMIDPRIRGKIEPIPHALTSAEARQLAADIVAVSDFYSLPLDFFLGIGAMENNYLDVQGDLKHAIWKRRSDKGDIVLKRSRGRVLVLNSSSGVWQITRETLRYAHQLYLRDRRDYSLLPSQLRPSRELDLGNIEPRFLTTYAGLIFRDLLDRCRGDIPLAVGAYNGGLGNPNLRYAEGVSMVAEYARRVMEQAAVLNGRPAAGMRFLSSGH